MDLLERATIIHFHRHRIERFGEAEVRALGWRDAQSQQRRFDAITASVDFNGASVLDVGCGRGDFRALLDERFNTVSYLGIDQMPEFIAQARRRFADREDTSFVLGDFASMDLPGATDVVASGALGYRTADTQFHLRMIAKMFAAASQTLVFNVLDAARFPDHPLLIGRDCDEIVTFCQTLSNNVRVVRNYLPDDITLILRKHAEDVTVRRSASTRRA